MEEPLWKQAKTIFEEVTRLSEAARITCLDQTCGSSGPLRETVNALLRNLPEEREIKTLSFSGDVAETYLHELGPGDLLGPFQLKRVLGEGGMGMVFLAEQFAPLRREVALKVIKGDMAGPETLKRFETERQSLALMDHPAIALALEAGAAENGQPYFAMEYVDGLPIDSYCDCHSLSLRDRVRLMLKVAEGVQHAHQKGIIHRDIKPSNILIKVTDGEVQPKIIDFGIAKAFEGQLAQEKTITKHQALIGTVAFMSPEQLHGLPADIRTDVFALSMVFYKLLVGTLPYEEEKLHQGNPIWQVMSAQKSGIPKPSTRFLKTKAERDELARLRRTTPKLLVKTLRSELDWIVLKGLEEDRARRYASVSDLIGDLHSFLNNQPIQAHPPHPFYKMGKFIQRHKAWAAAGTFALGALVLGMILALIGMVRAERAQDLARREAQKATAINQFLQDMLASADPHEGSRDIKVSAVLDAAVKKMEEDALQDSEVRLSLYITIGKTYHQIGKDDQAAVLLEKAQALGRATFGDDHPDTLRARVELGETLAAQGKYSEAESLFVSLCAQMEAKGMQEQLLYLQALNNLAVAFGMQGRFEEALGPMERALEGRRKVLGPTHPLTLGVQGNLVALHGFLGKGEEALGLARDLLVQKKQVIGLKNPNTLSTLEHLASLETEYGSLVRSLELHEQHYTLCQTVFGEDHIRTIHGRFLYGGALYDVRRYLAAEQELRANAADFAKLTDYRGRNKRMNQSYLAKCLLALGRFEEAEALLRDLEEQTRDKPNQFMEHVASSSDLALTLGLGGRPVEAAAVLASLNDQAAVLDVDRSQQWNVALQQCRGSRDWDAGLAVDYARRAVALAESQDERDRSDFALGRALLAHGRNAEAALLLGRLYEAGALDRLWVCTNYGRALGPEGLGYLDEAEKIVRRDFAPEDGQVASVLAAKGVILLEAGQDTAAEELLTRAKAILEKNGGPDCLELAELRRAITEAKNKDSRKKAR